MHLLWIYKKLPGKRRAKEGMFDGDLQEGELEIDKVSALLRI